jgi:hypothetical protein
VVLRAWHAAWDEVRGDPCRRLSQSIAAIIINRSRTGASRAAGRLPLVSAPPAGQRGRFMRRRMFWKRGVPRSASNSGVKPTMGVFPSCILSPFSSHVRA